MSLTSRKGIREALVTLLDASLVGEGLPVKNVYDSKQESIQGKTPMVVVMSRGSDRSIRGVLTDVLLTVQVWVLQSDGSDWTLSDAEDALDNIEALIAEVYEDSDVTTDWQGCIMDTPTDISEVAVSGEPYFMETIETRVILGST